MEFSVDTTEIKYFINLEILSRELLADERISNKHSDLERGRLVFKNNRLSSIDEVLKNKKYFDSLVGIKSEITRIDLAYDLTNTIYTDIGLYIVFLYFLNYVRKRELDEYYMTMKHGKETKILNLKIRKGKRETTIYNSEDKERLDIFQIKFNVRIETRSKEIRNKFSDKERIEREINKYINELQLILIYLDTNKQVFTMIEDLLIENLVNEYNRQPTADLYSAVYNAERTNKIISKRVLTSFIEKLRYKNSIDDFIKYYRHCEKEKRPDEKILKFIYKQDIKFLINNIINNLKNTVKNDKKNREYLLISL